MRWLRRSHHDDEKMVRINKKEMNRVLVLQTKQRERESAVGFNADRYKR